jgi:hypothetical protein
LSLEGRKIKGNSKFKCEKEVEKVMKQKILIPEDAVNQQIW